MMQIIESVEKVIHNGDRIFRWYSDGKVEMLELKDSEPCFVVVKNAEPMIFTVSDSAQIFKPN